MGTLFFYDSEISNADPSFYSSINFRLAVIGSSIGDALNRRASRANLRELGARSAAGSTTTPKLDSSGRISSIKGTE